MFIWIQNMSVILAEDNVFFHVCLKNVIYKVSGYMGFFYY